MGTFDKNSRLNWKVFIRQIRPECYGYDRFTSCIVYNCILYILLICLKTDEMMNWLINQWMNNLSRASFSFSVYCVRGSPRLIQGSREQISRFKKRIWIPGRVSLTCFVNTEWTGSFFILQIQYWIRTSYIRFRVEAGAQFWIWDLIRAPVLEYTGQNTGSIQVSLLCIREITGFLFLFCSQIRDYYGIIQVNTGKYWPIQDTNTG